MKIRSKINIGNESSLRIIIFLRLNLLFLLFFNVSDYIHGSWRIIFVYFWLRLLVLWILFSVINKVNLIGFFPLSSFSILWIDSFFFYFWICSNIHQLNNINGVFYLKRIYSINIMRGLLFFITITDRYAMVNKLILIVKYWLTFSTIVVIWFNAVFVFM